MIHAYKTLYKKEQHFDESCHTKEVNIGVKSFQYCV